MAKDIISLGETLSAPNSFAAGMRFAEELSRLKMRAVAARIVAALVNTDTALAEASLRELVQELRSEKLSVTEIDIEIVGEATANETAQTASRP